jgi:hypothetical protein
MRAPGPCRRAVGPGNGAGTFVAFFVFEEGLLLLVVFNCGEGFDVWNEFPWIC